MANSRSTLLFAATSVAVWLLLFWPFLLGESCFGFRDSAHLYFPLFAWIQDQWSAGIVPLWNPLDDFGGPLVADGPSSVFYPLKAIFFLTWVSYPVRFGSYVAVHVLLAAWGTYFLARRFRIAPLASAMSASGYALSGAVLFQTSNVIFLVGAAWLPWALACGWSGLRASHRGERLWCGLFVALMILGGDPQSAYHALLILGTSALCQALLLRPKQPFMQRGRPLAGWLAIALIAAGLAAVQWLPSWQWQQRSVRANPEVPRSIWESSDQWLAGRGFRTDGWFATPNSNTHHDHIYQFSQPPWTLVELVWPNISGKEFPIYQRWANAIPGADRVWTPSIYFGLLLALFAISGFRLWGRSRMVGLSWMTLVFGLGTFGWYGLGWVVREIGAGLGIADWSQTSAPLLGVYWWLVTFLPGYDLFRYPAKLLAVATLGASLIAGWQFTRWQLRPSRALVWLAAAVLVTSLLLLAISFWPRLAALLAHIPADATFGPFDGNGAIQALRVAFAHAAVVSGLFWILLRLPQTSRKITQRKNIVIALLAVAELTIANAWLVVGVPAENFDPIPAVSRFEQRNRPESRPRVREIGLFESSTADWMTSSAPDRLAELIQAEREALLPKFHLQSGVALVGSFHAIAPLDLEWFLEYVGTRHDPLWGINARVQPPMQNGMAATNALDPATIFLEEVRSTPRVTFVENWTPPDFSQSVRLRPDQKSAFVAAIEADLQKLVQAANDKPPSDKRPRPTAEISHDSINQVTVQVRSARGGWLVLKDYWDAGWQVELIDVERGVVTRLEPDRFCGIFRAIRIPRGGPFEARFVYRPAGFVWGAAISLASIVWFAIGIGMCFAKRTRTSLARGQ